MRPIELARIDVTQTTEAWEVRFFAFGWTIRHVVSVADVACRIDREPGAGFREAARQTLHALEGMEGPEAEQAAAALRELTGIPASSDVEELRRHLLAAHAREREQAELIARLEAEVRRLGRDFRAECARSSTAEGRLRELGQVTFEREDGPDLHLRDRDELRERWDEVDAVRIDWPDGGHVTLPVARDHGACGQDHRLGERPCCEDRRPG